jgi:lactate dehydrogenase-like 2-hydroxyacid dehydrogenase
MRIAILNPRSVFSETQQAQLSAVGEVTYMENPIERPVEELARLAANADVLAVDPDNFGGFEKAKERLTQLMEALPDLKGVALDTTSYGWIDLAYANKRNIPVCNCPGWSRESVAEHALALLLILAKNIIKLDRKTQKGEYVLEKGFELKGKTLGIVGVGNIGSAVAALGKGIGMNVIGYNHSAKSVVGVEMKGSLEALLAEADAISLNVTDRKENEHMIGSAQLAAMKDGVIIVNVGNRESVDEDAMAKAIASGKVFGYAYEGEDLEHTPLAGLDNAIGLKAFGWHTKEALENLFQIWVDNIVSIAKGAATNVVGR